MSHRNNKRSLLYKSLLVIGSVYALFFAKWFFVDTVNLWDELPTKVREENIIYGKIEAFLPDILYMKYRLAFVTKNPKIVDGKSFFYYMYNVYKVTNAEKSTLQNDSAVSFLKYKGEDGNSYLLTITGDQSEYNDLMKFTIKLYRIENDNITEIFNRTEAYSVDPGYESNWLTERVKLFLYGNIMRDDRYQIINNDDILKKPIW